MAKAVKRDYWYDTSESGRRLKRASLCRFKVNNDYRWSKLSGVSSRTINNFVYGKNTTCNTVKALADAALVPAGWLAFGEGSPAKVDALLSLNPLQYVAVNELSQTLPHQNGEILVVLDKIAFGGLLSATDEQNIVVFLNREQTHSAKYLKGDWVFVDRALRDETLSGDYCIDSGGNAVIREIVFRDDGTVQVAQPGYGKIPPAMRQFQPGEFKKSVNVIGRIVATLRMNH